jgi:hypothetical protein
MMATIRKSRQHFVEKKWEIKNKGKGSKVPLEKVEIQPSKNEAKEVR